MASPASGVLQVSIDYDRIAANAAAIKSLTGNFIYAVVKADGYGLGAAEVARAIIDVVDGFYVFDLAESIAAGLGDLGKKIIAVDQPWNGYTAKDYAAAKVTPIVSSIDRAREMASLSPVLAIDTGMRRFGIEQNEVSTAIKAGNITEAMTHAVRVDQIRELVSVCKPCGKMMLHGTATALLPEKEAWLDAVRPGLALYRGAARVSGKIIEARDVGPSGRAGYGQFEATRVGVFLGGYVKNLKPGICLINGTRRKIYEVGMQSAFVELKPNEGPGTEVVLLGDGLTEKEVATAWGIGEQEVLVRLVGDARQR